MTRSHSFLPQASGSDGTTLSSLLTPIELRKRVSDFVRRHRIRPQQIEALKQVLEALRQKEQILRARLARSVTEADRKRLHGELAILERQQDKGKARLELLSPRHH